MSDQHQPGQAPQPQPRCAGLPESMRPDLRSHIVSLAQGDTRFISNDLAQMIMVDCAMFLRQIISITSAVVESISVGQLRKIVGPELAKSIGLIDEHGKVVTELKEPDAPADEPKRDHRKGPRGGKHPMVVLIQIALQASKLLERIARGTNPHVFNTEHYQSRVERQEQREENRQGLREIAEFRGIAKDIDESVTRAAAIKR